jgi:hypothetical protein
VKLSQARESYHFNSGTASSVARQAAFAGIAIIWVFNSPTKQLVVAIPQQLQAVALLLVICLALDLLQYVVSSIIWSVFSRILELKYPHRLSEDPEMDAPPYLNWPCLACFWGKLFVLMAAYIRLAMFLLANLSGHA